MKKGLLVAVCGLLLLAFSQVSAQLYIGPALQAGMTYSKNFVIDDTSKYYIGNSASPFFAGGVDFAYQFDKHVRVQLGVQGQYRAFNLKAPEGVDSLTFTNIKQNTIVVAIPATVNFHFPIGKSENKFFNIMAGHSLDFLTKDDSTIFNSQNTPVDSGNGFARQELQFTTGGFPVSTVLLGIGADFVSAKGNVLNVSLVWGISTRQIFRGSVREWDILHQDYDPNSTETDPEEFPDHYYEWALRGSNLSLKASYYFQLGGKDKEEGKDEKRKGDDESGKVEKPAKEKAEKPEKVKEEKVKEEKAPKEKKEKGE